MAKKTKKTKKRNWYLTLEDGWVTAESDKVRDGDHFNKDLFVSGSSSEIDSTYDGIRGSIRIMIVSSLLFIVGYISPYPLAVYPFWLFCAAWIWKNAQESKMTSGYPYLEPSDAIGLMFQCVLLIPFLFIGYAIMTVVGGLVEGRLYTALVQFGLGVLVLGLLAAYGLKK
ncbi:hypothetical protein OAD78_02370 [Candidatus Thioglobus sp.]|nr:hypothetical protein [Candidatus Thioglobus sp.]